MVDIARLRIIVDLDSASVVRGAASTTAALNGIGRASRTIGPAAAASATGLGRLEAANRRLGTTLDVSARGLSTAQVGFLAFGGAAAAVAVGLAAVVRPAIQFESAFAGVQKTVEATPQQLNAIRTGLIDLSRELPTSANELANIAEAAGQLGVEAPQVLEFTNVVARLAETTDLDFDTASTSLARFLNVTEGGVQGIEMAGNVLVALGNNSATTESQILTFSQRLAGAFTAAGATSTQILSVAAAFSSLGIMAEAGGSALSRVITEIADAAINGGAELDTFASVAGLSSEAFADLAMSPEGAVEAFRLFEVGLGEIIESGGSITPILQALGLDTIRVADALRRGAIGSDVLTDSLRLGGTALSENSALAVESAIRFETTAAQIDRLVNRINALAIAAGTPLLAGLVDGAVAAGDGIERLAQLLGPLGAQLGVTFSNAAAAGSLFIDAIGGPALSSVVAALNGVLVTGTSVVAVLNSFGPAGVVIAGGAAAIALYPPALVAARAAALALAINLSAVGVSGTAAAVGARALQLAISAGPLLLAAAAITAVGAAFISANAAAQDAAASFRDTIGRALDANNIRAAEMELGRVGARIGELEAIDQVSDGLSLGWDNWRTSILSVGQILTPFTENTIVNARAEAAALREELEQQGYDEIVDGANRATSSLDLNADAILAVGNELGNLNLLQDGTVASFLQFVTEVEAATEAERVLAEQTGLLFEDILEGQVTLGQLAESLGLTEQGLRDVAATIDGVEIDDLTAGGEMATAAFLALAEATGVFDDLASRIGTTAEAFAAQVAATRELIGANQELTSSVDEVIAAYGALNNPALQAIRATRAFGEAIDEVTDVESLILATNAAIAYTAAFAASGGTFEDVVALQGRLVEQLTEVGIAAGLSASEISEVVVALAAIPPESLVTIVSNAEEIRGTLTQAIDVIEDRINMGLPPLPLDADGEPSIEELNRILDVINGVTPPEILIDADGNPFIMEAEVVQGLIDRLIGESPIVPIEANTEPAQQALGTLQERLSDLPETLYQVFIEGDASGALGAVNETGQAVSALTSGSYQVDIDANNTGVLGAINETGFALSALTSGDYEALLTADESDALEAIETVRVSGEGLGAGFDIPLRSDPADAIAGVGLATAAAQLFVAGDYVASLGADAAPALDSAAQAGAGATGFALADYLATLTADPGPALADTGVAMSAAQAFAAAQYLASLTAEDSQAASTTAGAGAAARAFAAARYQASLTADGTAALGATAVAVGRAFAFARGQYSATLRVDSASALIRIGAAVAALSRFQSRTITLTTRLRTVGSAPRGSSGGTVLRRQHGGITVAPGAPVPASTGPVSSFQHGAITGHPLPRVSSYEGGALVLPNPVAAGVLARPNAADIFSPATPFRAFAEPAAGWEAFIPQYGDRLRNRNIWETTGRRLGFMQHGGLMQRFQNGGITGGSSTVNQGDTVRFDFSPIVDIRVDTGGGQLSNRELAGMIRNEVRSTLDDVGRDLLNSRRAR